MNNFIFGVDAVLFSMSTIIKSLIRYPLFWGFAVGFLVSTLVHGFLISGNPKHVPVILFNENSASFQKLHKQKKNGLYTNSYSDFLKIAERVKLVFSLAFLLFASIVLLALLKF